MFNRRTTVRIKKLHSDAQIPAPASKRAAGMDLCAYLKPECDQVQVSPGRRRLIKTGIALAITEGYEGQVRPRSGLAHKQGITVLNSPGTLDSDYRGEVGVILINHGEETITIKHGERIAQLVIMETPWVDMVEVDELDETARGDGGFGSTGR